MRNWTLPNYRKFLRILLIVRSLHSAASAISDVVKEVLCIISWLKCSIEKGNLGATCADFLTSLEMVAIDKKGLPDLKD